MLGHNVFHVPIEKETKNLLWFECDRGVRRLAWAFGAALLVYWGWFLYGLAEAQREGWVTVKVLVGLLPLVVLGALAIEKPRAGGVCTVLLGLVAAAMAPALDVAAIVLLLSILAGGLMAFSAHR